MDILRFDNPKKFAAVATPLLMRNEAENCFWLGMLSAPEELAKAMMCIVAATAATGASRSPRCRRAADGRHPARRTP